VVELRVKWGSRVVVNLCGWMAYLDREEKRMEGKKTRERGKKGRRKVGRQESCPKMVFVGYRKWKISAHHEGERGEWRRVIDGEVSS